MLAVPSDPFEGFPVTAFKLLPHSPAIDRGALISSMGGRDFFGVTMPQGANVDIGASEYEAALWTVCAPEGGVCAFTGTTEVRYGADGAYVYQTLTDGTACTNEVFGDPIYGTVKACAIRIPPAPTEWTFCARKAACARSPARSKCATGPTARMSTRRYRRHRLYQRGVRRPHLRRGQGCDLRTASPSPPQP